MACPSHARANPLLPLCSVSVGSLPERCGSRCHQREPEQQFFMGVSQGSCLHAQRAQRCANAQWRSHAKGQRVLSARPRPECEPHRESGDD